MSKFIFFVSLHIMTKTIFYNNNPITLSKDGFNSLKTAIRTVKAGGGLVRNAKGEYLMIFRRGKWDLPKGKLDSGETITACAIREVNEETGVSGLKIVKKLPSTYHLFTNSNGEIILKKCYWFEMETLDEQPLQPQIEEDITEAVWLSYNEVEERKTLMFGTIRQCLEAYFALSKRTLIERLLFGRQ
ncbi:MAG: NUDIX domain-containing protein [Bacteroidales bacterium]|jgi:ADP-ribose pyrophosphatase YjhB (NUDIX family)|nr:NUDIX domain-containing protein [Bacteroidales bacterium]